MTEHHSRRVVITSDVHFPHHHRGAWTAFCEWVAVNKPYRIILNGDMIDFAALSRYDKSGDEALPSDEIAEGIEMHVDSIQEQEARLDALRLEAWQLEGCSEPTCSCHARRTAAIEELAAMQREARR